MDPLGIVKGRNPEGLRLIYVSRGYHLPNAKEIVKIQTKHVEDIANKHDIFTKRAYNLFLLLFIRYTHQKIE